MLIRENAYFPVMSISYTDQWVITLSYRGGEHDLGKFLCESTRKDKRPLTAELTALGS
jgi:hypothetical protein